MTHIDTAEMYGSGAVEQLAFFAGLLSFLREIFLATANLRIGPH